MAYNLVSLTNFPVRCHGGSLPEPDASTLVLCQQSCLLHPEDWACRLKSPKIHGSGPVNQASDVIQESDITSIPKRVHRKHLITLLYKFLGAWGAGWPLKTSFWTVKLFLTASEADNVWEKIFQRCCKQFWMKGFFNKDIVHKKGMYNSLYLYLSFQSTSYEETACPEDEDIYLFILLIYTPPNPWHESPLKGSLIQ